LDALGVVLSARADRLVVNAPVGAATPEIKAELQAHKRALMVMLAGVPSATVDRTAPKGLVIRTKTGPRDFRNGDRWLPWHFTPEYPEVG
jgi:hypothetical protein